MEMNKILLVYQRETDIPKEMIYRDAAINQMCFIRDKVCFSLLKTPCFILSTHRSKSIELPVYGFIMRNGVKVIARCNFYDWTVSVELPGELPEGYLSPDLFYHRLSEDSKLYFQGFKDEWIYDTWLPTKQNLTKFSCELYNDYYLFTFLFRLKEAFPKIDYSNEEPSAINIANTLEDIYRANGVYKMVENRDIIPDKVIIESLLQPWESVWWTHYKFSDYLRKKYDSYKEREIEKEPAEFAKYILEDREILNNFIFESKCFGTEF